jgi:hypothetical protein
MSKNAFFQNDILKATIKEPITDAAENSGSSKFIGRLRKIFYLTFLAGMGFFFNGCVAGYVETEPVYVEYSRPHPPSNVHIWIDGDWHYNSYSHGYVQNNGYWAQPRQGQSYVTGHWQSNPKGKSWSKGYWAKNGQKNNRHD